MHQRLHVRNWANRQQIDPENDASARHKLRSNLAPPARGGTQVDANLRRTEEVILLVDLTVDTRAVWGKDVSASVYWNYTNTEGAGKQRRRDIMVPAVDLSGCAETGSR